MKVESGFWTGLVHLVNFITFNTAGDSPSGIEQVPLKAPTNAVATNTIEAVSPYYTEPAVFPAPNGPNGPSTFTCNYTAMKGWRPCSTPQNRGCWLRGPPDANGLTEYNITTNYEKFTPTGIVRRYDLVVSNMTLSPDGFKNNWGKVFNESYPGPWIQACWGDTLEISVTNLLPYNGTTIHWHGIRQAGSLDMDGVNGVTQCPISYGDHFVYKFNLTQYGTAWYHSHYSLQYADGMVGPMTIYGPSSANYDEAIDPLLVTDWNHRSAFEDFYLETTSDGPPKMTSILLNGRGNYTCTSSEVAAGNCTAVPDPYNATFSEGKKYLMRLINTAVDTTFIFSIDNHTMTVIGNDFVPIKPYTTNAVLVGIGQRYHVIVEATKPLEQVNNYWIRATPAKGCSKFHNQANLTDTVGIIRYNPHDTSHPTTISQTFSKDCTDEPYASLIPIVPWRVGPPSNHQEKNTFQAGLSMPGPGPVTTHGNVSRWELGARSMWLNFSDPTIAHAKACATRGRDEPKCVWDAEHVVVDESSATSDDDWVYMLITAQGFPFGSTPNRNFVSAAHPIHLHGHDFAVLAQSYTPYWDGTVRLNTENPPRRDVALLPSNGYLVIAFKADNPGTWIMHCHIAWHASSGLALQILERAKDIRLSEESVRETERVCGNWDRWFARLENHWDRRPNVGDQDYFQDDSGI